MTTPLMPPEMQQQKIKMNVSIDENGSVEGTVDTEIVGTHAATYNETFKKLTKDMEKKFLDGLVKKYGLDGQAEYVRKEYDEPKSTYHLGVKFSIKNFLKIHSPGGMYIYPLFESSNMDYEMASTEKIPFTEEFPARARFSRKNIPMSFQKMSPFSLFRKIFRHPTAYSPINPAMFKTANR